MARVSMKDLLESGVHFGHLTRRWNPRMKRYIYGERNGIYIVDLHQTLQGVEAACDFIYQAVLNGGAVLFVGTKKQAQEAMAQAAERCGMFHVTNRWLGGMLTNFQTIRESIHKLKSIKDMEQRGVIDQRPKKEAAALRTEFDKLQRNLGGIEDMPGMPDVVFVIDVREEHIAVKEAKKLGIKVVAVVDTNCDPTGVDYVIPGNDDAIRAITLISDVVANTVTEAAQERENRIAEGLVRQTAVDVVRRQREAADTRGQAQAAVAEAEAAELDDDALDAGGEPDDLDELDELAPEDAQYVQHADAKLVAADDDQAALAVSDQPVDDAHTTVPAAAQTSGQSEGSGHPGGS